MTIEYNQSLLSKISSNNPDINAAAAKVNEYTELAKTGQISYGELADLIADIQSQVNIQSNMAELDAMNTLNTAINGLIMIAKMA
jgi:hypothetical protein